MPHLIWSQRAIGDLLRLQAFLEPKSPAAARKAAATILQGLALLTEFSSVGRPVEGLPDGFRDLPITFSASGYIVRYRLEGDIVHIVAIRHAREAGF